MSFRNEFLEREDSAFLPSTRNKIGKLFSSFTFAPNCKISLIVYKSVSFSNAKLSKDLPLNVFQLIWAASFYNFIRMPTPLFSTE